MGKDVIRDDARSYSNSSEEVTKTNILSATANDEMALSPFSKAQLVWRSRMLEVTAKLRPVDVDICAVPVLRIYRKSKLRQVWKAVRSLAYMPFHVSA